MGTGTAAALVSAASSSDSEWFGAAWALVGQRLCIRQTRPGPATNHLAAQCLSRARSKGYLDGCRHPAPRLRDAASIPETASGKFALSSRRPPGLSPLSVPTPPGRSNATVNASPGDGEPKTRHEAKVGATTCSPPSQLAAAEARPSGAQTPSRGLSLVRAWCRWTGRQWRLHSFCDQSCAIGSPLRTQYGSVPL
jgi:hypothetical protein